MLYSLFKKKKKIGEKENSDLKIQQTWTVPVSSKVLKIC